LLSTNTDLEIERALKRALSADDIKDAVHSLIALHGVGVKMVSAILTAIYP
jgi:endonuclease III